MIEFENRLVETKPTVVKHVKLLFELIICLILCRIVRHSPQVEAVGYGLLGLNVRVDDSNPNGGILSAPVKKPRTSDNTMSISPPNEWY